MLRASCLDALYVVPVLADVALDPLLDAPERATSLASVVLVQRLLRPATLLTFLLLNRRWQNFAIFAFKVN